MVSKYTKWLDSGHPKTSIVLDFLLKLVDLGLTAHNELMCKSPRALLNTAKGRLLWSTGRMCSYRNMCRMYGIPANTHAFDSFVEVMLSKIEEMDKHLIEIYKLKGWIKDVQ